MSGVVVGEGESWSLEGKVAGPGQRGRKESSKYRDDKEMCSSRYSALSTQVSRSRPKPLEKGKRLK